MRALRVGSLRRMNWARPCLNCCAIRPSLPAWAPRHAWCARANAAPRGARWYCWAGFSRAPVSRAGMALLLQQCVDGFQILHRQRASRELEIELVDHVGVACLRVIAFRLEQRLLREQHVDDGLAADFVAGLGGLQRLLRGYHRFLLRLHLADAGADRIERVAGVGDDLAAILLQDVACLVALGDR